MLSQPMTRSKISCETRQMDQVTFGLLSHALGLRSSTYSLTNAVLTRHEQKVLFYVGCNCSLHPLNVNRVEVQTHLLHGKTKQEQFKQVLMHTECAQSSYRQSRSMLVIEYGDLNQPPQHYALNMNTRASSPLKDCSSIPGLHRQREKSTRRGR